MNREDAIAIANSLNINISEDVINDIILKHKDFLEKIDLLKQIDTKGIEPMHRVDESETSYLREDIVGDTLPVKNIIENAPEANGNFITIAKVVK